MVPSVSALANTTRLERVIANLVGNAMKYSSDHQPVVLEVDEREGSALISVIDRGIGIPEADIPHVFDKFYRAKSGKKAAGLGLGLYIAKAIVEAHGGVLRLESVVGKGSKFIVALPAVRHD